MPSIINDPKNGPHPPPPPPDLGDGSNIPKGNKKTTRHCTQGEIRACAGECQSLQRPDHRRVRGRGPGHHDPGTHTNYPSQNPGGAYPPGYSHPGSGYNPPGSPAPGYGPPNYPVAGGAPPPRPNPVPQSSVFAGGGYRTPEPLVKNWRKFLMNQKVEVNVAGNGWLVGFVVAVIEGIRMVTNSQVRVRYTERDQYREDLFDNHPAHIRPYQDSGYH